MYSIAYQLFGDKYPTDINFDTEKEMKEHYIIWVEGDDFHFCIFFKDNREYEPEWVNE